jgi:hypothetical protein
MSKQTAIEINIEPFYGTVLYAEQLVSL